MHASQKTSEGSGALFSDTVPSTLSAAEKTGGFSAFRFMQDGM